MLTCAQHSRAVVVPSVDEPVAAPAPPVAVPVEATDAQTTTGVAVDRTPEKNRFTFPVLRNEVGIGEQVVKNVSVQDRLAGKFLAEIVAFHHVAVLLTFGAEELHKRDVQLEMSALLVLFDFPAVGDEGVGIAVDDVFHRGDGGLLAEHAPNVGKDTSLAKLLDLVVRIVCTTKRHLEFVGLTNIEHKVAHGCISLVCDGVQYELCRMPEGSEVFRFTIAEKGLENKPLSAMVNASYSLKNQPIYIKLYTKYSFCQLPVMVQYLGITP